MTIQKFRQQDIRVGWSRSPGCQISKMQVLAAGLENPPEGGEGIQYRCCIHTRDWKVKFLNFNNCLKINFWFVKCWHLGWRNDPRPDHPVSGVEQKNPDRAEQSLRRLNVDKTGVQGCAYPGRQISYLDCWLDLTVSTFRPSKTRPRGWSWLWGTRTWSPTRRAWRRTSKDTSPSTHILIARIPGSGKNSGTQNVVFVLSMLLLKAVKRLQTLAKCLSTLKVRCLGRKTLQMFTKCRLSQRVLSALSLMQVVEARTRESPNKRITAI